MGWVGMDLRVGGGKEHLTVLIINAILDGCSTVDSKLDYDGIGWYSMVFDGIAWYSMVFCY